MSGTNTAKILSEEYYKDADKLEERVRELENIIASKPDPSELPMLEKRLWVLRGEVWDLRRTAGELLKIGSEPPETPSLAAREKGRQRRRYEYGY
ncbi:hypothetical protein SAMN02910447_00454 [Ruminococcus sp. YE71]|uniref:hypothetical protein n=1 Tax=unclassified Ruminococcus TaxID=2608920 RepID=UPI00087F3712|nr:MULTISPECIES: hypothetical protein [unclassified Ruminococcus]SDA11660.1 hypothetical protein SAMN02910446_00453 [Ruminococcus sp. YE78]SFW15585.1 hypothetical protein SAMN02910447_00454 [Ruminococcus sp. YE71]